MQQELRGVALPSCLGEFSRRIRLAGGGKGEDWGSSGSDGRARDVKGSLLVLPYQSKCLFLLRQIGKVKLAEDMNLKRTS